MGSQYEVQYWLKFVWYRGFWIKISFRRAYLVFVLWEKLLQNIGWFKFSSNLFIKHRILKIFNLKTRLSYHLTENLHGYTNLCDNLHQQNASDNNKDVQVYFNSCLPRQYLHSLHSYEWTKNIVDLDIVCLIHPLIYRECLCF